MVTRKKTITKIRKELRVRLSDARKDPIAIEGTIERDHSTQDRKTIANDGKATGRTLSSERGRRRRGVGPEKIALTRLDSEAVSWSLGGNLVPGS